MGVHKTVLKTIKLFHTAPSRRLEGITLGLSIGVAEWHDGESLDEVLDVADRKMFQDKALRPQFSPARNL